MSVETREMKEIEAAVEGILFRLRRTGAYRPHLSGGGVGSTNGGACAAKAYGLLQL